QVGCTTQLAPINIFRALRLVLTSDIGHMYQSRLLCIERNYPNPTVLKTQSDSVSQLHTQRDLHAYQLCVDGDTLVEVRNILSLYSGEPGRHAITARRVQ